MSDLGWIYIFNIIINMFFSFITVALLVRLSIMILSVRQPRLKALMLALPLFKVILDLYLYDFSKWALAHEINPFWVMPGSRTFLFSLEWIPGLRLIPVTVIQLILSDGKTFTFADLIALYIGPWWVKLFVLSVMVLSVLFVVHWLFNLWYSRKLLGALIQRALACTRNIDNPLLNEVLRSSNTHVMLSPEVTIPCCFGLLSKYILIPQVLVEHITQSEFEAIIAHELNHLTWYDAPLRLFFQALAALLWWIPLKRWIKHVEGAQELACDSTIHKFALAPIDLADALVKVARHAKQSCQTLPIASFFQAERMKCRIEALLKQDIPYKVPLVLKMLHMVGISSILIIVALGKFWIF